MIEKSGSWPLALGESEKLNRKGRKERKGTKD
jgi:hypothetical protein